MKKKLNLLAISAFLISYPYICNADDGEVFFNDKLTPEKPNVLFLLDVSGSMAWAPYADKSSSMKGEDSRIEILKQSLTEILNDTEVTDIRAGMMTFTTDTYNANNRKINIVEEIKDIDTNRQALIQRTAALKADGGTPTVPALYEAARYITPNSGTSPSHSPTSLTSPIIEGCQLSHIILMSDGQPNSNGNVGTISSYIGGCKIITGKDSNGKLQTKTDPGQNGEQCGRSITSWMSYTDQAPALVGDNYIRTHTIGFALRNYNGKQPVNSAGYTAQKFLTELAEAGQGKALEANNRTTLVKAFKEIIRDVRAADGPSASGTVSISAEARYDQRTEVFYSLYSSSGNNYWPGNMKRYKIAYIDTTLFNGTTGQRAILVDKNNSSAMSPDGTFYDTASSFWANSNKDGGKVSSGGAVAMLSSPNLRNVFTYTNGSKIDLKAGAKVDLGVTADIQNGLLNFIRGYTYVLGGSDVEATKKLGDAARGRIALATYDCITAGKDSKKDLTSCEKVNQTAILASNDGFIRGYNTNTGEAVYEYMPEEMLPLIKVLQDATIVSYKLPRYYGLDGKPVIYKTTDKDGYINGKAYAYVAAGRGGAYIYALNISNTGEPTLKWKITSDTNGFSKLGYTWSTPALGNIKINGTVKPVLFFGGGYDKSPQEEDTQAPRSNPSKGNTIYIVDAKEGNLLWSASAPEMNYSIPSEVALVKDSSQDKLVTDIIVGDMGGQVWRFSIDNNSSGNLSIKSQVIAKLAGTTPSEQRKFYQVPAVFETTISGIKMLVVNIGSGFRNHPLNIDIKDRIYSIRVPKEATTQPVITEDMLAVTSADGQSVQGSMDNGFMIKLTKEGEKVITDGYADFDRLVFNTFIPSITDKKTCVPSIGTQRTYNFDLITGKSLLETAFISIGISTLPPDVTTYCDGRYCTIIADPSYLSKEKELPKGKEKDAYIVDTGGNVYIKTGATDLFDISSN